MPFLFEELCRDAMRRGSRHDFGGDIIPSVMHANRVFAYPFMDENRKQTAYWRDVGTLDAYYEANMDLVSVDPQLNMYDAAWPIRTYQPNCPPAKFVFADQNRRGVAPGQHRLPGAGGLRRSGRALGHRAASAALTVLPMSRSRFLRRRQHRPARKGSSGDHRQGREHSRWS